MRVLLLAGGMVAGLLGLAGCAHDSGAADELSPGFLRVPKPRDATAVADRPCALLPPQQAAAFGIDRPPRELPRMFGHVDCEWRSSQADVWIYVSVATDSMTLKEVYDRRESLPYFELTDIEGYPAIVSRPDATLPVCDIDMQTAPRQSVTVSYDSTAFNKDLPQGCVVGRQVARMVLLNLPLKG